MTAMKCCMILLAYLLLSSSAKQTRIIGGDEVRNGMVLLIGQLKGRQILKDLDSLTSQTDEDRYPYAVALTKGTDRFFCGGSLIAHDVVLTAGVSSTSS